jgi:hypothetical protein
MHSFTDLKGRTWNVAIKVGQITAIQTVTGIDFAKPENFGKLVADTVTTASIVWCLIRKQAEALNLAEEEVWDAFDDKVFCSAIEAVSEELLDFFRRPPALMNLKAALEGRAGALQQQAQDKIGELTALATEGKLDKFLGEPAKLDKLLAELRGVTNAPASSASIPPPSACANSNG